jgi:hypothetical protein
MGTESKTVRCPDRKVFCVVSMGRDKEAGGDAGNAGA